MPGEFERVAGLLGGFSGGASGGSVGANLGSVYASVELRADGVEKGAKKVKDSMKQVEDETKKSAEKINRTMSDNMREVGKRMASVFATAALINFGREAVNVAAKFERFEKAIRAVDGAGKDAKKTLDEIIELSKGPGLLPDTALRGFIRLRQAGLDAELAKRTLAELGNALVSAGRSAEELDPLVSMMARMKATGELNGRAMLLLTRTIPGIGRVVRETFGTANIQQIAAMGVTVDQFIEKLTAGLSRTPRITGTAAGAFKNLGIAIEELKKPVGDLINSDLVPFLNNSVVPGLKAATTWFKGLPEPVKQATLAMVGLAAAVRVVGFALGSITIPPWLLAIAGAGIGTYALLNKVAPPGQGRGPGQMPDYMREAIERQHPRGGLSVDLFANSNLGRFGPMPLTPSMIRPIQRPGLTDAGRLLRLQQMEADVSQRITQAQARAVGISGNDAINKAGAEIARLTAYQRQLQAKIDKLTPKTADQLKQEAEQAQREAEQAAEQAKREAEQQAQERKRVLEQRKADTKAANDDIARLTMNASDFERRQARAALIDAIQGGVNRATAEKRYALEMARIRKEELEAQKQHDQQVRQEQIAVVNQFAEWTESMRQAGERAGQISQETYEKNIQRASRMRNLQGVLGNMPDPFAWWAQAGKSAAEQNAASEKFVAAQAGLTFDIVKQISATIGYVFENSRYRMSDRIDTFKENMRKSFDFIPDLFSNLADEAYGAFTGTLNKMFGNNPFGRALARTIDRWMSGMMDQALASLFTRGKPGGGMGGQGIAEGEPNFVPILPGPLGALLGGVGIGQFLGHWLGGIFKFQDGGPVPGPIGYPHLAVVHGGEYVMSRAMLAGAGAGQTINITVPGMVIREHADVGRIAEQIAWRIRTGSRGRTTVR